MGSCRDEPAGDGNKVAGQPICDFEFREDIREAEDPTHEEQQCPGDSTGDVGVAHNARKCEHRQPDHADEKAGKVMPAVSGPKDDGAGDDQRRDGFVTSNRTQFAHFRSCELC